VGATVKGILFGVAWFLVGGAVGGATAILFAIGSLGGITTPPAYWWVFVKLGVFLVPPLLSLSGIPPAIRIAKERPWIKLAAFLFAFDVVTWLVIMIGWTVGAPT
jgi:hypothetical protein